MKERIRRRGWELYVQCYIREKLQKKTILCKRLGEKRSETQRSETIFATSELVISRFPYHGQFSFFHEFFKSNFSTNQSNYRPQTKNPPEILKIFFNIGRDAQGMGKRFSFYKKANKKIATQKKGKNFGLKSSNKLSGN